MAEPTPTRVLRSDEVELGRTLVEHAVVAEGALEVARERSLSDGISLADALIETGAISRGELLPILGDLADAPAADLEKIWGDPLVLEVLPKQKAFELLALPLFLVERQLTIAVTNPRDLETLDMLRFITGKEILPVVALESDLRRYLVEYYGEPERPESDETIEFDAGTDEEVEDESVQLESIEQDRPVIRLANLIIRRAIEEEASDIHIEPLKDKVGVRYRIDGRLHIKPFQIPKSVHGALVTRIKVLAKLDITEHRVPQDGKIQANVSGREVDLRISVNPTIRGEKVVIRILDKEKADFTLDSIGMSRKIGDAWRLLCASHEGIILVTGPTGSGKSSTLYATLRHLHQPEVNIVTLEDPVEYELEGISQSETSVARGYTFAKGLRSFLRQDPDIILVGEIRDEETARVAIQASLTGHLVLSTLHTNDGPATVTRLIDMGVQPYLVAASVIGVLAQRLVRRPCAHCLDDAEPTRLERELFGAWLDDVPFREGAGCSRCHGTGYRGRTAVHELLRTSGATKTLIARGATADELAAAAAAEGYRPLWFDGVEKVREEGTTLRELARVVAVVPRP